MTPSVDIFSATAADYAATMVPALRPVAAEVVRRAGLAPGERVVDCGTGTGIGAAAAVGDGREVTGVDRAPGMLAIARLEVPAATFLDADFTALPFADGAFDAVIAVHALLFADHPAAALREWRRVCRPGGRLSLSTPGPAERTPAALFEAVYDRYGIDTSYRYPSLPELAGWAANAGWGEIEVDGDPNVAIRLADESAFSRWRRTGSRGAATTEWTQEQRQALARDMLSVVPRDDDGTLTIPFGAFYLAARRPA